MNTQTSVPVIDIHTHVFPERLAAAVRGALESMYGWKFVLPTAPEAFAAFVRERGTERFVILPYAHKPGMAASLNTWVAHESARLEGAIGFACIHQDDDDPRALLEDAFAQGLRGIKLHHQVQNVAPDDPRLDPIYRTMLEYDRPLLVHAGRGPTDNGLVGLERFRAAMERFPDLRVCVAHMGAPEIEGFVALLDAFPNLYLDTSGISHVPFANIGIEQHLDRIIFGTDAPNIPYDYEDCFTRISELNLGPDAERMIYRDNALRFLGDWA